MNRRDVLKVLGAGCWGWGGLPIRRARNDVFVERWSWAMGQVVHVMLFAGSERAGLDACAAALAELRRVGNRLTLLDAAPDPCEPNRRPGRTIMRADADLRAVPAPGDPGKASTGRPVGAR